MRKLSEWRPFTLSERTELLDVLTNQTGYLVSLCKLTYDQAFCDDIWGWIQKQAPRVIWLKRANLIRQAVSQIINRNVAAHKLQRPQHSFEPVLIEPVAVSVPAVIRYIEHFGRQNRNAEARLNDVERVFPITYEEIMANPKHLYQAEGMNEDAGKRICAFLGVPYEPMPTRLMRIHPGPLSNLISNWRDVREALQVRHSDLVKGEQHWNS
jgi:hypothetical protein